MYSMEDYFSRDNKLSKLSLIEMQSIFGGDRFSEAFYFVVGYLFEKLDQAARRGAPVGNTYKHSG